MNLKYAIGIVLSVSSSGYLADAPFRPEHFLAAP